MSKNMNSWSEELHQLGKRIMCVVGAGIVAVVLCVALTGFGPRPAIPEACVDHANNPGNWLAKEACAEYGKQPWDTQSCYVTLRDEPSEASLESDACFDFWRANKALIDESRGNGAGGSVKAPGGANSPISTPVPGGNLGGDGCYNPSKEDCGEG